MPRLPRRPCASPGCPKIATNKYYCAEHAERKAAAAINALREYKSRPRESSAKRGYDARWRRARQLFLIAHPRCAHCGAPATVVDHIISHRGNPALMWDRSNWQPLCAPCHSKKTMTQDVRGRRRP